MQASIGACDLFIISIMKTYFEKLSQGYALTQQEAYTAMTGLMQKELNATQTAAVLAFYRARPITLQELSGMAAALEEHCIKIEFEQKTMDVCGTGGDGRNTFNISTLSAIVLAASGIPVAKHGNYGSTSVSGSSDILKYLGYEFTNDINVLRRQLDENNICFLHAPLFHPALSSVASLRKEIGFRTFFNLIGPLTNPANISAKFVGVYNQETARLYHYYLQTRNIRYTIVNSIDGYDEISLTDAVKSYSNQSEKLYTPAELNFEAVMPEDIVGGHSMEESARIFVNVLLNKETHQRKNVVLANAAAAYCCYSPQTPFHQAVEICKEAIDSGKAFNVLKNITRK